MEIGRLVDLDAHEEEESALRVDVESAVEGLPEEVQASFTQLQNVVVKYVGEDRTLKQCDRIVDCIFAPAATKKRKLQEQNDRIEVNKRAAIEKRRNKINNNIRPVCRAKTLDMQAVLHFVQQAGIHRPDGVSYADICKHLKRRPTSLYYCLKDLVEDGALYTTIDDEHFQFLGTWEICRTCSVVVSV